MAKQAVVEIDPRELFKNHLVKFGIKQKWLADTAGYSEEHVSNILACRVLMTDEARREFNEALGTNF